MTERLKDFTLGETLIMERDEPGRLQRIGERERALHEAFMEGRECAYWGNPPAVHYSADPEIQAAFSRGWQRGAEIKRAEAMQRTGGLGHA